MPSLNASSLALSLSRSLSLSNHSSLSPSQQRKKPAASAASTKPAKKEPTKAKAATGAGASTAAPQPSPTPAASALPARLELACSMPGSSEPPLVFVAEGATRKFVVGRVKNGRLGLCLRDDSVSSKHAEIEWVAVPGEGQRGQTAGGAASSSSAGGGGGGRAACAARGGRAGATRAPPSSSSPPSSSTSNFLRPQALGGAWVLRDLGSSNGTAINGLRVEPLEPYELKHTDEISFGGSSTCSVALSLCEPLLQTVTVERYLATEAGKKGDELKAAAERAAGGLRARFRTHKEQVYRDALAAWRASVSAAAVAAAAAGDAGGGGGDASAAAKERLHASLRKLRLWTIDRGGGVGGGGSGGGGGVQEDAGKENVDA